MVCCVVQCVVVCCCVFQCVVVWSMYGVWCDTLCGPVCYGVLLCVPVCCCVFQCVVVWSMYGVWCDTLCGPVWYGGIGLRFEVCPTTFHQLFNLMTSIMWSSDTVI